jgi:hypothetical protein
MVANGRASLRRKIAAIIAEPAQAAKVDSQKFAEPAQPAIVIAPLATHGNNGNGNGSHPAPTLAHVCEYCGAEFAKAQSLSAHLRYCGAYQTQKSVEVL